MGGDTSRLGETLTWVSAMAVGMAAKKLLNVTWLNATGEHPPKNPASRDTAWREALMWGAVAGAVSGMARIVGRRVSADVVASFTGDDEADLDDDA